VKNPSQSYRVSPAIWDHSVTREHAPHNPSHIGWYSIYIPQRDGSLSWPWNP